MPDFTTRLSAGLECAADHLALALVPVLFALLDTNKILAITSFDGGHVGFRIGIPFSVVTVWQFVSVPQSGVNVEPGVPIEALPLAVVTVPALLVVQAAVAAGYFGSLRNALAGAPYDFLGHARRYFLPFLVLTLVPFLFVLPLALGVFGIGRLTGSLGTAALALVVPAAVLLLVAAYLFYGTPYLLVLRDTELLDAARGSYSLAIAGGPYLAYAAGYAVFVLLVSPVATAVVVNLPLVGVPLGVLAGGFVGLGVNLATMRFLADVDPSCRPTSAGERTRRDPAADGPPGRPRRARGGTAYRYEAERRPPGRPVRPIATIIVRDEGAVDE